MEESKTSFKCEACGIYFTDLEKLVNHVTTVHANDLIQATSENKNSISECNICGKRFDTNKELEIHAANKHDNKTMNFISAKEHLKRVHTANDANNQKRTECYVCGKTFNSKSLRRHYENVHLKLKNQQCNLCDERFSQLANLKRHRRLVHEGTKIDESKNIECDICLKTFSNPYILRKHKNAKHENVKKYICEQCNKHFSYPSGLSWHKLRIYSKHN